MIFPEEIVAIVGVPSGFSRVPEFEAGVKDLIPQDLAKLAKANSNEASVNQVAMSVIWQGVLSNAGNQDSFQVVSGDFESRKNWYRDLVGASPNVMRFREGFREILGSAMMREACFATQTFSPQAFQVLSSRLRLKECAEAGGGICLDAELRETFAKTQESYQTGIRLQKSLVGAYCAPIGVKISEEAWVLPSSGVDDNQRLSMPPGFDPVEVNISGEVYTIASVQQSWPVGENRAHVGFLLDPIEFDFLTNQIKVLPGTLVWTTPKEGSPQLGQLFLGRGSHLRDRLGRQQALLTDVLIKGASCTANVRGNQSGFDLQTPCAFSVTISAPGVEQTFEAKDGDYFVPQYESETDWDTLEVINITGVLPFSVTLSSGKSLRLEGEIRINPKGHMIQGTLAEEAEYEPFHAMFPRGSRVTFETDEAGLRVVGMYLTN